MTNRYNRHIILSEIGQEGQDKISQARVLVIGAGGLGCPVLQYLTAAGVGTLGIVDFDVVDMSNLQRQVLFGTSSLGENKAIAAKKRLEDLNDSISINVYPEKLTHKNALELFNQYDIIVDGSDNFATRYLVNDASVITNKPLVFGAIYKFEGQVSVFNYNNGPSYRCLFPTPPEKGAVPNCSEVGVLGVLPGIIGNLQANEVLKIILEIGKVLSGTLLCYNALNSQMISLKISKSEKEIEATRHKKEHFHTYEVEEVCELENKNVSIVDLIHDSEVQIIDVREAHETPKIEGLHVLSIPLSQLETQLNKIDQNQKKAIFCQSGIRSKRAVSILTELGVKHCYNMIEGAPQIQAYLEEQHKALPNGR